MGFIYYVSTDGSDLNSGTEGSPFQTIQCAANISKPGDTIFVQPGIYRERVSPPVGGSTALPITYQSVVPRGAIIRGSIPWKPVNSYPLKNSVVYSSPLLSKDFTDTSAMDGPNPFRIPICVTPYGKNGAPEAANKDPNSDPNMVYTLGQVFVNDIMYIQTPYKSEMEKVPNQWFYDMQNNQLYVNVSNTLVNPIIEITNQRRLFAPHVRGLKNIIVTGFIIERCGNQYPNKFWSVPQNQQAGAIGTRCGKFWTIQKNVIRYANGVGIDWGNEGGADQDLELGTNGNAQGANGHTIQNNIISDNGAAGTASYMCKNFIFSGNTVERNNNLKFYGKRRWESAGIKVHCPTNSIIMNNLIRNNYGHGIWSDQGAGVNSTFKNNIIVNNYQSGINFEIGTNTSGKVVNNIFDANEYGVSFVTSGGVLVAHNLFLSSITADIHTNIFTRTSDKWDSLNIEILYNLFMKSPQYLQLTVPKELVASRYMNYNYYNESNENKFQLISMDGKTKTNMKYDTWQSTWASYNLGKNADENSVSSKQILPIEGKLDEIENGLYQFTMYNMSITSLKESLSQDVQCKMEYVVRSDIKDDYYAKDWSSDNCFAGPFVDISNRCFRLNKAFII